MGADANCTCVMKEEEGELKTTPSELLQTKNAPFSYRNTQEKDEKEEEDPSAQLIEAIQRNLSDENNKKVKASIITLEDFEAQINRNPKAKEILSQISSELNGIDYEKSGLIALDPLSLITVGESNGDSYLGSWNKKGQASGMGTLTTKEGVIYKGIFCDGLFNGEGVMIGPKGDYYFGDWRNGECEGKGELSNGLGYYFKGDFKSNKKNGKGIEHFQNGSMYEGEFEENEKHGQGKLTFEDGSSYEGNFHHSVFNGEGVYMWKDGRVYEGEFRSGYMNGKGKHKWEDGSEYTGTYVNNKKCGQGIYMWNGDKELAGNWMNNEPHGKCFYLKDKMQYEVIYRFGKIISSKVLNMNYTGETNRISLGKSIHFNKEGQMNSSVIPVLPRLNSLQNKEKIANLPDFVCQICHDLVENPHQCKRCSNNYCYNCIYNKDQNVFKKCLADCKESFAVNTDLASKMKELKYN